MTSVPTSAFCTISEAREFADQNGLMTDEQIAAVYREPDGRRLTEATVQRTRRIAEGKLRRALRSFAADVQ
jgi:hypothetical protein